jgi:hypothetical protein
MVPVPRFDLASRRLAFVIGVVLAVAGCGIVSTTPPAPTPADFQGIAAQLTSRGVRVERIVSGEAGCDDQTLRQTAIALDASGLDQPTPVRIYLYIFRNRASFERLRQTVDGCARSYVTDASDFASIEASPFVVASPGPWGPEFQSAVRAAVTAAAGTGD